MSRHVRDKILVLIKASLFAQEDAGAPLDLPELLLKGTAILFSVSFIKFFEPSELYQTPLKIPRASSDDWNPIVLLAGFNQTLSCKRNSCVLVSSPRVNMRMNESAQAIGKQHVHLLWLDDGRYFTFSESRVHQHLPAPICPGAVVR